MKQARVIVHFEYVTEKKNDANKMKLVDTD